MKATKLSTTASESDPPETLLRVIVKLFAAIAERVVGLSCSARQSRDGWWVVGHIFDQLDDVELDVWFDPERRRIGVSPCQRVAVPLPPTPPESRIIFDGERMKWIDRETHQVVPAPRERHG